MSTTKPRNIATVVEWDEKPLSTGDVARILGISDRSAARVMDDIPAPESYKLPPKHYQRRVKPKALYHYCRTHGIPIRKEIQRK